MTTFLEVITKADDHKKYYPIVDTIASWVFSKPPKVIDEETIYDLAIEIEEALEKYRNV